MQVSRREALLGVTAVTFASNSSYAEIDERLTPETFGAKGDGVTNDTDAFAALSVRVNQLGGGIINLRPVVYIVGKQTRSRKADSQFAFAPAQILSFLGCTKPVVIRGNGATLRSVAGLRYGIFARGSGEPMENPQPRVNRGQMASPYHAMVRAEGCKALVEVSDLELDGNSAKHLIGGRSSRRDGWQIPATGIQLVNNSGQQRLSRIRSHHHPLDGLTIYRQTELSSPATFADVICDSNGRQGCSITGGRNFAFERCRFLHNGKGVLQSRPGAGVDIEAGRHAIRDVSFSRCEFSDNAGPGMVADSGDSEKLTFDRCAFIGTTSRAAWPNKPGMRFSNCLFAGSIVRVYGDADPARAAQFHDCRFTDDPSLSQTTRLFGGRGHRKWIAVLPKNSNVLFHRCRFELIANMLLPCSTREVFYSDCTMTQAARQRSHPAGTYLGTCRLTGNIDLSGSIIKGFVILNDAPFLTMAVCTRGHSW